MRRGSGGFGLQIGERGGGVQDNLEEKVRKTWWRGSGGLGGLGGRGEKNLEERVRRNFVKGQEDLEEVRQTFRRVRRT